MGIRYDRGIERLISNPYSSFLLPAVFMLLLVACGGTQPLPDIDATVEARVELAKVSLVAPTYTPIPTYTPAPAPEVVVKEAPVEKTVEVVVTATPTPTQVPPTPTPTQVPPTPTPTQVPPTPTPTQVPPTPTPTQVPPTPTPTQVPPTPTPTQVPPTPTPTQVPPTPTPTQVPLSITIEELPEDWQSLSKVFSKYVDVFGVHVFATEGTRDSKVIHGSNVLAQYLDNNADGIPDNAAVVEVLSNSNASIFMAATEDDMESVEERLPESVHRMMDSGQLRVIHLYGEETNPSKAKGEFDASLEEVLHLITEVGYAQTYPGVFAEERGSTIAKYMDIARGGHFEERRDSDCEDDERNEDWKEGQCALPPNGEYPTDAWYTYLDPSCDYACMVTEYFYWALTSLLGAQSDNQRCNDISEEWVLCTDTQVKSKDPDIYTLLTDPQYALPTKLPDGNYTSSPP